MSTTSPSSTSSFCPSTHSSSQQSSRAPSMNKSSKLYNNRTPKAEPTFDEPDNDLDEGEVTTTTTTVTTTVVKSPSCAATPRFASPPAGSAPATPMKGRYQPFSLGSPSPSPTKSHQHQRSDPFPNVSPSQPPVSGLQYDQHDASKGKGKGNAGVSSSQHPRYRVPHPDKLPPPPNMFPTLKVWYVVTVGQEVGIFHSWLDVKARIRGVPDPTYVSQPTYAQALQEYRQQYEDNEIWVILLPGSKWANLASTDDEYEDEYEELAYDEEVNYALCDTEAHAAAEKVYKQMMEAHGYKV